MILGARAGFDPHPHHQRNPHVRVSTHAPAREVTPQILSLWSTSQNPTLGQTYERALKGSGDFMVTAKARLTISKS